MENHIYIVRFDVVHEGLSSFNLLLVAAGALYMFSVKFERTKKRGAGKKEVVKRRRKVLISKNERDVKITEQKKLK